MKRLYTLTVAFALCAFMSTSYAQVQQTQHELMYKPSVAVENPNKVKLPATAKGDQEVFWSEDFSNGPDGQDDNGAWTTDGPQGDLWFLTFPAEDPNGYDETVPVDGYGDFLPNYWGEEIVTSPTRDNGVMFIDADRWNSTSTAPDDDPSENTTSNPLDAKLVSPTFDLSGQDFALVSFWQSLRLCCANASAVIWEFSVDNGDTWIPYDVSSQYGEVNDEIVVEATINISDILQQVDDLTQCKMRFSFTGEATHYFWNIDDIAITALPDNDLAAGATFLNSYHSLQPGFDAGTVDAVDYYDTFDMWQSPTYLTRPMNFAMEVTNAGAQTQTNVQLVVTATSPSGIEEPFTSDPIDLEAAVTDTLTIEDVTFLDIVGGSEFEPGQYTYDFEVIQDEEDERPNDNFGASRSNNVNFDVENDDFGIYWNGREAYNGAYTTLGQDVIWSTPYTFTETDVDYVITHVEAVFQFNDDFAETVAGEVVYFNVRSGSVLEEDETMPETITTTFFDSENPIDYADQELEFIIEESDIWNQGNGLPYTWASFELPSPILIEAGQVYQAEYRVPAAGSGIVFPPVTGSQEQYAGTLYDFEDGDWFFLGFNTINTRFRTQLASDVDDVTYESGVQLLQNYPNPAVDNTRIQYRLDETMDITFEVYDMAGKLVHTEDMGNVPAGAVQNFEFNVSALSSGMYTYSIVSENTRVTRKLTVQ
ncbi:MAG: T9SS type A sorting domain-containing protein [Cryomorphaceae bacterium]|nr:T9SS type A sorting domain-containing protein [Flavobacteriales bacterium]